MLKLLMSFLLVASSSTSYASPDASGDLEASIQLLSETIHPRSVTKVHRLILSVAGTGVATGVPLLIFGWGTSAGMLGFFNVYMGVFLGAIGASVAIHETRRNSTITSQELSELARILKLPPEQQLAMAKSNPALAALFIEIASSIRTSPVSGH